MKALLGARADVKEGRLSDALYAYRMAYAESPSDALAAEIGLDLFRMKNYLLAAQFLDLALYGGRGAKSPRSPELIEDKLFYAREHVVTLHVVTNVAYPNIFIDDEMQAASGWPLRVYTTPGPHRISVRAEGHWERSLKFDLKAGESREINAPLQARLYDRIAIIPSMTPVLSVNPFERREPEPWGRPTLVTSGIVMGLSVGVGIAGVAMMVTGGTRDDTTYKGGLATVIVAGAGLGLSLTGLVVGLVSIPPQPGIELRYGEEPTPGARQVKHEPPAKPVTVSPAVGRDSLGLTAQGVF